MSALAIQKIVPGNVDHICGVVTEAIQKIGFGVLTRIDFDQKIKEKLNETMARTVVLGACNPRLAFEAFKQSTDTALLIPCNIVVRDLGNGTAIIEAMRPTQMLKFISGIQQTEMIEKAEKDLEAALLSIKG